MARTRADVRIRRPARKRALLRTGCGRALYASLIGRARRGIRAGARFCRLRAPVPDLSRAGACPARCPACRPAGEGLCACLRGIFVLAVRMLPALHPARGKNRPVGAGHGGGARVQGEARESVTQASAGTVAGTFCFALPGRARRQEAGTKAYVPRQAASSRLASHSAWRHSALRACTSRRPSRLCSLWPGRL